MKKTSQKMDNDTISSPGHFSDRTFFVTPAVKRFSSLLSVINIDSLIVCLQMTHLLFILLLCSGKLPLRCAAKISVYSKNCGLPFLTDRSGSNAQSGLFLSVKTNPNVYLSGRETTPALPARSGTQATSQTGYGIPGSRHSRRSDHGPGTWNPTFLRQLMRSPQRAAIPYPVRVSALFSNPF